MRLRGGILAHMPATAANLSQVVGDYASLVLHDLIDGQGVAGDVLHDAPLEEVVSPRATMASASCVGLPSSYRRASPMGRLEVRTKFS